MSVRGVDYSHYQNPPSTAHAPDPSKMLRDGVEFVIIKAWEADHSDPNFIENMHAARNAGMPAMAYVFLHSGDNDSRMQKCFDLIGTDTVLCLDWEDANTPASIVEAWMDAYEGQYNRRGMCYYGLYPPGNPTARIGEWPRWFPQYNTSPKLPPWDGLNPTPDWRECYAIWQNSDSGHVDGVSGPVDTNFLAPSLNIQELVDWLNQGRPPRPHIDIVEPAIKLLQLSLNMAGYNAGAVDGLWGPHTQQAIDEYSGWKE